MSGGVSIRKIRTSYYSDKVQNNKISDDDGNNGSNYIVEDVT